MWRKQEDQLKASTYKTNKKCLRKGIVKWPELEAELKAWVVDNRNSGIGVSTKMVMNQARDIARVRGINGFKGQPSWCQKFMKRNKLAMRVKTTMAQKMPQEYEYE